MIVSPQIELARCQVTYSTTGHYPGCPLCSIQWRLPQQWPGLYGHDPSVAEPAQILQDSALDFRGQRPVRDEQRGSELTGLLGQVLEALCARRHPQRERRLLAAKAGALNWNLSSFQVPAASYLIADLLAPGEVSLLDEVPLHPCHDTIIPYLPP